MLELTIISWAHKLAILLILVEMAYKLKYKQNRFYERLHIIFKAPKNLFGVTGIATLSMAYVALFNDLIPDQDFSLFLSATTFFLLLNLGGYVYAGLKELKYELLEEMEDA